MAYSHFKLGIISAIVSTSLLAGSAQGQQSSCASGLTALTQLVADRTTRLPLLGAMVIASWRSPSEQQVTVVTDSSGKALLCIPADANVAIRSTYLDYATANPITISARDQRTAHTLFIDVPNVLLRGRIVDQQTGLPVAYASVRVERTNIAATTDADGRFTFPQVPAGDFRLHAEHVAYAGNSTMLQLREDDLDALVRLAPAAIPLQPIVVTVFSRRLENVGFYERQKRGVGTFINRKQIDDMNVLAASDLLRNIPSMRLIPSPRRPNNQVRNATVGRRGNCRFSFIIDGARTLGDLEIDNLAAGAIEGIEIYNGLAGVPAVFRAHASTEGGVSVCGVILVWTRNSR